MIKIQRLSFDDQINYFGNTTLAIKAKVGEAAANKLLKGAVYFVGIGKTSKLLPLKQTNKQTNKLMIIKLCQLNRQQ